ncbi:response regulator transcription factor [Natronospora cellulosivora (SeqCode)]
MYKVMIVDDEPNIRRGLPYLIDWEECNFRIVSVAKNGRDAIEKLSLTYPDIIITDITMPGMSGLDLIKHVRGSLNDKNMGFIILSGYNDFEYAKEAIKYNVQSYLLKPIDEKELLKILSQLKHKLSGGSYEFFYNRPVKKFDDDFSELKEFNSLVNHIEANDHKKIEATLRDIFDYFNKVMLHPNIIKIHLDNFFINISKIINLMGGDITSLMQKLNILEIDFAKSNLIKLRSILEEFSLNSTLYIAELKSNSGIINKVKQYIKRNYYKNIKLKDIAEDFYINPAYLGRLFKKETGFTYCDYLNKIRLQYAKQLLERTDLHIYQIADKVGYKNSDYFIIKFKECENCTPLEYKNKQSSLC